MASTASFQTVFAVPMTCESCVKNISSSLYRVDGVSKVEVDLDKQVVAIEGTASPSSIVGTLQAIGRDAILRGSGVSDMAAVCILETHSEKVTDHVKGLVRMVQVSDTTTLLDFSIQKLSPGTYWATIRETGDISKGALTTGAVWDNHVDLRGSFGSITVGKDGNGSAFIDRPIRIWEMIGRALVVSKQHEGRSRYEKNDSDTLVGVIARSAGVWDNDKTVCSCSGKTLWEERDDEKKKGML